jgi:16S rRNA G527 N7-methylase RsmG
VHLGRLEEAAKAIEPVEVMTSRATYRIPPTLAAAARLVVSGGAAVLWKGSGWRAELDQGADWRPDWDLVESRPIGTGPSVVVRFTRK